ncbi:MAG: HIT domain-containing protein [Anaerolineales bacterium]
MADSLLQYTGIMDYLWSPWRMEYILTPKSEEGCIFCNGLKQADGAHNLIVYRGPKSFVMLNRFPYTSGHLMIIPFDHQPSLELLDADTRMDIMDLSAKAIQVLQKAYSPQGFNLGMNIGSAAGAGISEHVHLHVVPRWVGDTNFMSSVSQTRVLPESLEETYRKIRQTWEEQ